MPLYEYQCKKCKHRFEKIQLFSDKPIKKCPECGGPVEKLLSAPAIQFKGSGWYVNDYAKKSSPQKSSSDGDGASGSEGKSKSSDSESSGAKSEAGSKTDSSGAKDSGSKESASKSDKSESKGSRQASSNAKKTHKR